MRLGYFVPEFPGQTHIFFIREIQNLRNMGVDLKLVSTRLPRQSTIVHPESQTLINETAYLFPPTGKELLGAIGALLMAGPGRWNRYIKKVFAARDAGVAAKLKMLVLAVTGAQLGRLAQKQGWSHVHVHSCANAATIALAAHVFTDLSYSLTLHAAICDYGPAQKQKWENARFAITVNNALYADIHNQLAGHIPETIVIAPMGVDVDLWHRSRPYEPWSGDGPFRVVMCARLHPGKGHHILIDAIKLMVDDGIDVHLNILGGGDNAVQGYREKLQNMIQKHNLHDRVHLLGVVPEDRVRACLDNAHAFVLASFAEAMSVATMEAMAMEVPAVVTRVGGMPELIKHETNGLLIPPGDPRQMAAALTSLARDPQLAARLSAASRQKIRDSSHHKMSPQAILSCLASTGIV